MCTAASYKTKDHYFGRNFDYEISFHEGVTVTPRNFVFNFRKMGEMRTHYAMIGMVSLGPDYPLYYEATNEKGLSMAGLNFPGTAVYQPLDPVKDNITPFEFIPWILGQCATVAEAGKLLSNLNMYKEDFSEQMPLSPLHWMIADRDECIVAEPMADGLKVFDDPVKVMTNNPTFDWHMTNLANYMSLSPADPVNAMAPEVELRRYSRGMGSLGLPGDMSSASRFVKAAFTRMNSLSGDSESESISQFFHILASAGQQRGCCKVDHGYEYTIYSSCCNTDTGVYYYTTYENSQITAIDMHRCDLDGDKLVSFPLITGQQIRWQN